MDVKSINVEGGGRDIDYITLRNGGKLSGVVAQDVVRIQLADQQRTQVSIAKDKIREIILK